MIVFAAIMPHPPESIPGIGSPADFVVIKKTLAAFDQLRRDMEEANPDTILIISPHAYMEEYSFVVNSESRLRGSLKEFGPEKVYEYENNSEITSKLKYACDMCDGIGDGISNGMPSHLHAHFLDHGALIPLYHLTKNIKPKIVHLSFSLMSYERHYRYGEILQKIIDDIDVGKPSADTDVGRIAIIASGDLSHMPGNDPSVRSAASEFDHSIIRYLGGNDLASFMGLDEEVALKSRECGLRSIIILLGILHGKEYKFELLSYEAPFGVGYMTARLL
jgi:aromatic ring-opening dioxygenase LigB subunit